MEKTYLAIAVRVHQFTKRCMFLYFELYNRTVLTQNFEIYVFRLGFRFLRK